MNGSVLKSVELRLATIKSQDCTVILTDHAAYGFRRIVAASKLVVDTRNATKDLQEFKDKIIKLGAGNNAASPSQHEDDTKKAAMGQ
jgi:UDP-N-acetyl-D-mannosaminuronate dehydrogenase